MEKQEILKKVADAIDVETFLVCKDKEEGKQMGLELLKHMGFEDTDVVFAEYGNGGARLRLRAYVYRPGDLYAWAKEA